MGVMPELQVPISALDTRRGTLKKRHNLLCHQAVFWSGLSHYCLLDIFCEYPKSFALGSSCAAGDTTQRCAPRQGIDLQTLHRWQSSQTGQSLFLGAMKHGLQGGQVLLEGSKRSSGPGSQVQLLNDLRQGLQGVSQAPQGAVRGLPLATRQIERSVISISPPESA